jgi:pyruvate/2-oxoacid:ferredoxin oxidoreductase beta subunit
MASAPAAAQGIRDALDILLEKKRIPPGDDLQVITLTGDGSAYGMGLSATSAAMDRNLDFIYLCYDNEGYGNTGQQYSSATPPATPATKRTFSRSGPRTGPPMSPPSSVPSRWTWRRRSRLCRGCGGRACSSAWPPAQPAGVLTPA